MLVGHDRHGSSWRSVAHQHGQPLLECFPHCPDRPFAGSEFQSPSAREQVCHVRSTDAFLRHPLDDDLSTAQLSSCIQRRPHADSLELAESLNGRARSSENSKR